MIAELSQWIRALRSGWKGARPELPRLIPPARRSGFSKSFDGSSIFWELHGPDPAEVQDQRPMVFCYGLVCSMNQWRAQLERYSQNRPCLLVDYRGHHQSDFPQDPRLMNISALARDVLAAARDQGFRRAPHFWGHSMGVNVALEAALAEPESVASLILLCGTAENPFRGMLHTDWLAKTVTPLLRLYPLQPHRFEQAWRLLMLQPAITQVVAQSVGFNASAQSTAQDTEAYSKAVANIDPKTFFPLLLEMSHGLTQNILPRIQTPALIVAGARDHVTPSDQQQRLAAGLRQGEYVEIPLGSHNVQLDFGEYVGLKAEEFWAQRNLD